MLASSEQVLKYPENHSTGLRFGKLNLICVTSDEFFGIWEKGTAELKAKSPVTRDAAIAHFAAAGITPRLDSAGEIDVVPVKVAKPVADEDWMPF